MQLIAAHESASAERWEAEQREQGVEVMPSGMPLASVGEEYAPDPAWQRALAEKRRLMASQPRMN